MILLESFESSGIFWNLFRIFCILLDFFGFFWILLDSLGILRVLLESFGIFWNLLAALGIFRRPSNAGASQSLILWGRRRGAISFFSSEHWLLVEYLLLPGQGNLQESFGVFWNLLESFGIFWNLLECFGIFWILFWNFFDFLDVLGSF